MDTPTIEKSYKQLQTKYNLPAFEDLNEEFELSAIEESEFLLSEVRKRIADKINNILAVLDEILFPEATPSSMHECNAFSEEEKKQIMILFRRIMALSRESSLAYLKADEASQAEFIGNFVSEWIEIKKDLNTIFEKLRDAWIHELEKQDDAGYFG